VSDIIVHPDYKFDLDTGSITNDVAVIVLEDKLDNNGGAFAEISPAVPSRGVAVGKCNEISEGMRKRNELAH